MWRSYAGFRGWLWGHLIFRWARLGFLMLLWWVYLLEQRVWFYGPSNYIGLEAQTEGTTSCLTTLGCGHFLDLFCAYLSTLWPVHIFKQFIVLDTSHTYLTWRAESGDFMLQDKMPTCRLNTLLIDTQLFAVKLPKKKKLFAIKIKPVELHICVFFWARHSFSSGFMTRDLLGCIYLIDWEIWFPLHCRNLSIFQIYPIHLFVEILTWSQTCLEHRYQRDKWPNLKELIVKLIQIWICLLWKISVMKIFYFSGIHWLRTPVCCKSTEGKVGYKLGEHDKFCSITKWFTQEFQWICFVCTSESLFVNSMSNFILLLVLSLCLVKGKLSLNPE